MDKDDVAEEIELAIAILAEHANLTPDHQRFIDAMIRGVFYCGHCKFEKVLSCCDRSMELYPQPWFCPEYEERKEGEDG